MSADIDSDTSVLEELTDLYPELKRDYIRNLLSNTPQHQNKTSTSRASSSASQINGIASKPKTSVDLSPLLDSDSETELPDLQSRLDGKGGFDSDCKRKSTSLVELTDLYPELKRGHIRNLLSDTPKHENKTSISKKSSSSSQINGIASKPKASVDLSPSLDNDSETELPDLQSRLARKGVFDSDYKPKNVSRNKPPINHLSLKKDINRGKENCPRAKTPSPIKFSDDPKTLLNLYSCSSTKPKSGMMRTFRTPLASIEQHKSSTSDPSSMENINFFLMSLSSSVTPTFRRHDDAIPYIEKFSKTKEQLLQRLGKLFNSHVFDNALPADMIYIWNARLTKTAGICCSKTVLGVRTSRIELSTKVCNTAERVRDTLIHEMCHAAVWIINGLHGSHGREWKRWAERSVSVFPALPRITRCHSYKIDAKFMYRCVQCSQQIKRHSKSLDAAAVRCGICKGTFELLVRQPATTTTTASSSTTEYISVNATPGRTPKFAMYVKSHYSEVKRQNPTAAHVEIMNNLAQRFKSVSVD